MTASETYSSSPCRVRAPSPRSPVISGRDSLVFQPPEQPPQLGPEDAVVRQAGKQRFDGIEDDPLGSQRPNRVIEPDEQPFQIVLAGFLDLAAFDAHVVDRELPRVDQPGEVEPQGSDIAGNLLLVLLERHQHARFVEKKRAIHQKGESQQGLARPGPAADQCRPASGQAAAGDLVQARNSCQGFRRFATRASRRRCSSSLVGLCIRFASVALPNRIARRPRVDARTAGRMTGGKPGFGSGGILAPRRYRRCYILDTPANGPERRSPRLCTRPSGSPGENVTRLFTLEQPHGREGASIL